jgi:hypothetical protein
MLAPVRKAKKCRHCRAEFFPARPLQKACGPSCALELARATRLKAERKDDRTRREKMKPLRKLMAEAQREFNSWVRERDKDQPCICCGRKAEDKDLLTGSRWDAGHYRSTGSASHLRFSEDNCHRQLVLCNRHGGGRAVDYRIGLIARIGLARVEALEADNAVRKWTREELIAIKTEYAAKRRALLKQGETE